MWWELPKIIFNNPPHTHIHNIHNLCNLSPWVWLRFAEFLPTMSITTSQDRSGWMRLDYITVFSILQALLFSLGYLLLGKSAAMSWGTPVERAMWVNLEPDSFPIHRSLNNSCSPSQYTNYRHLRYPEPEPPS